MGYNINILFFGSAESIRADTCTDEMQMARHLVDEGNNLILCSDHNVCDKFREMNQTISIIPNLKSGKIERRVVKRILAYDYDVAFAASLSYAPLATFFAREKAVKSVVQVLDIPLWRFGLDPKGELWRTNPPLLTDTDRIIANTKVTEDILVKMGVPKAKIKRIYIGVNHHALETSARHKPEKIISCVSRCAFHKALDLGLYAFKMANVGATLNLIGHGEDRERLKLLASMLNLNAKFLGFLSERDKIDVISSSLFGIYPSICPTIGGLFPLESLACGRPCIVWDTPINHDIYGDSVEYVPLCDLKGFSEEIKYLLNNPDYRFQRAQKGKEWVLKNRTYKLYAEQLTEVLSKVC